MAEIEGDAEILETLHDVAIETVRIRQDLKHRFHFGALERHAARHDQADVAGADDHHVAARQIALHVDHALRCAGGEDAGWPAARDTDGAARSLATTHRMDHRGADDDAQSLFGIDAGDDAPRVGGQHREVEPHVDAGRLHHLDVAMRVAWSRQFLLEPPQAETVVDALLQNAAEFAVALDDQHSLGASLLGADRSGHARRTAADRHDVVARLKHRPAPRFPGLRGEGTTTRLRYLSALRSQVFPVRGPGSRPPAVRRTRPGICPCSCAHAASRRRASWRRRGCESPRRFLPQ